MCSDFKAEKDTNQDAEVPQYNNTTIQQAQPENLLWSQKMLWSLV
jgi:hypothetical protein